MERDQNTTTPTTPGLGEWGVSGTTLYWHPNTSDPVPGDSGAVFEYVLSSILWGVRVQCPYVEINDLHLTKSPQHGLYVIGTAAITNINAHRLLTDYNGNQTMSAVRLGNGVAYGYYTADSTVADSVSEYNVDHGFNAESLSGTNPKPRNITFSGNISRYNGSCGVTALGLSGYQAQINVLNNQIHNNGTGIMFRANAAATKNSSSGIVLSYAEAIIKNNKIYSNDGAGIWLKNKSYNQSTNNGADTKILSNLIYGNNTGTHSSDHDDAGISTTETYADANGGTDGTLVVQNNTIINNGASGLSQYFSPMSYNIDARNNIISGHTNYDLVADSNWGVVTATVSNNIFSLSGPATAQIRHNSVNYTPANLATWNALAFVGTDAMVDPLLSGYHLLPSSPAIGAGSNTPVTGIASLTDPDARPITDGSGNVYSRWIAGVEKTSVDIGAYQYPSDALAVTATGAATGGYFNVGNPYTVSLPDSPAGYSVVLSTGVVNLTAPLKRSRVTVRLTDGTGQTFDKILAVGSSGSGKSGFGF